MRKFMASKEIFSLKIIDNFVAFSVKGLYTQPALYPLLNDFEKQLMALKMIAKRVTRRHES